MDRMQALQSRIQTALLAAGICLSAAQPARAAALQDDFTRCLVSHLTPADQDVLVTWTFALISLSPKLHRYTSLTAEQRTSINQSWADLHTRLLTKDCRAETLLVFKADGEEGIVPSLKAVTGGAIRAMLATPDAHAGVLAAARLYMHTPQMDALRAEAGLLPHPQ